MAQASAFPYQILFHLQSSAAGTAPSRSDKARSQSGGAPLGLHTTSRRSAYLSRCT